ncbi:MAG: hypothetical protein H7Z13_08280 [Ferruginibacter sp.]|nr:hypothetical protein [Ferruginibacter sp.]
MKSILKPVIILPCFLKTVIIILLAGCNANNINKLHLAGQSVDSSFQPALIFQSGFEHTCQVIPYAKSNHKIVGKDLSLSEKNDWVADLDKRFTNGNVYINYTGGDSTKRFAKIIDEPGHPSNKVLWFWLNDSWLASENQQKARVQVDLYGIRGGYKEFYQSIRVFLHNDFNALKKYPAAIKWLTIAEFWNNEWWVKTEKYGFRITLGIGKPTAAESDFYFILNAENAGQKEVWTQHDHTVKVPVGKWFTMDYYYKEGNNETGRFYMAITPDGEGKKVVYDVKGYTHNTFDPNPGGVTGYNPMKLYTSKEVVGFMKSQDKTLQIYWDDFKLWTNKQHG